MKQKRTTTPFPVLAGLGALLTLVTLLALPAAAGGAEWQSGVSYSPGDVVTYQGMTYECLQAHTSLAGWEPPNVPALWAVVPVGTPTPTPGPTPTPTPSATSTQPPPSPTPRDTPPGAPARPIGLTATAGSQSCDRSVPIVLWWEPVTGATSYNVKRSAASGGPYATIATGVGDRFYSVPDLTPGWFVVSAVNDVGEGLDSVEARGDVHYVGAPCTPTPTPRPCPAAWNPSVLYPSSSRVGHQGYEWQGSGNPGDEPGVVPTWSIVRPCGYPPTGVPPAPHSISGGDAVMGCNFRPCIIGWTRVPGSSAYNVKRPVSPTGVGETLATTPHTAYALLPGSPGVAVTAVVNGVEGLRTEQASCRILVSDCISCSFYPTWSVSQSYAAGTTVAYGRYFWRSTRATVGEEPGTTTAWQVQMRCS